MMQQVATQKTDIAALPFSASSTAKAVEAGMGSEGSYQNNTAFESAYIHAKESGAKALEAKDRATSVNNENATRRRSSDQQGGNVDLPPVRNNVAQREWL